MAVTSAQKQARFSSKSVSTDGAEGRCLNEPNVGKNNSEPVVNLSSANETVASFLRSITFKVSISPAFYEHFLLESVKRYNPLLTVWLCNFFGIIIISAQRQMSGLVDSKLDS